MSRPDACTRFTLQSDNSAAPCPDRARYSCRCTAPCFPRKATGAAHPLISSVPRAVTLSTGSGHTVDKHSKRICNRMTFGQCPGLAGEIRRPGRRSVGASTSSRRSAESAPSRPSTCYSSSGARRACRRRRGHARRRGGCSRLCGSVQARGDGASCHRMSAYQPSVSSSHGPIERPIMASVRAVSGSESSRPLTMPGTLMIGPSALAIR